MKISLLMNREPFDKIFEKTLSSFLTDYTNQSHHVKWHPYKHKNQNTNDVQKWYCIPLINSIFVKGANPTVFDSISGEYSNNPLKPWRGPIQKIYLWLSKHKITAPLMAKYIIEVSPPIEDATNKLIIGGNTKIRIIDVINKRVFVILKIGFDKKYLEREIYVREKFKNLPIPKINLYGKNGLWYCEDYVSGISPDRMEKERGHDVLWKAILHMHKILNETKREESLSEYVKSLYKKIMENLDHILTIDKKSTKKIKDLTSTLVSYLDKYTDQNITTAYTHGDFQEGNIIYDGEKTWILDWEYSGFKQIGYDLFVLVLKSRVSKGFIQRFLQFYNNESDTNQVEIINNWPELNWSPYSNKKIDLLLFLLEELDFHLSENNNKVFRQENKNINIKEIGTNFSKIINKLNLLKERTLTCLNLLFVVAV